MSDPGLKSTVPGTADSLAPVQPRQALRLVIADCPRQPSEPALRLGPGGLIGREEGGALTLPDDRVSRRHAQLERRGATIRITDLGSRNGTAVNGVRLPSEGTETLEVGDVVRVGDSLLVLDHEPSSSDSPPPHGGLLGISSAACRVREQLRLAATAPRDVAVLLTGETGTGKEVMARELHRLVRRGEFVPVNCGAIPEGLIESQLFGVERGAFTGAEPRPGWFREANRGTLFLDEVGELPLSLQPRLLRVLQDRAVVPVGGAAARPHTVDVRVVAASNASLSSATFRADLLARLSGWPIALAPLRERRPDIPLLFRHFLKQTAPGAEVHPAAMEALCLRRWPYNVRGLQALARRLGVLVGRGGRIERHHLPGEPEPEPTSESAGNARVVDALRKARGNVSAAARRLGVSRKTVYQWCEQQGVEAKDFR